MGSWGLAPRLIPGWAAGDQPPGSSKGGQLGISPQAHPRVGSWGAVPRLIQGWAAGDQPQAHPRVGSWGSAPRLILASPRRGSWGPTPGVVYLHRGGSGTALASSCLGSISLLSKGFPIPPVVPDLGEGVSHSTGRSRELERGRKAVQRSALRVPWQYHFSPPRVFPFHRSFPTWQDVRQ